MRYNFSNVDLVIKENAVQNGHRNWILEMCKFRLRFRLLYFADLSSIDRTSYACYLLFSVKKPVTEVGFYTEPYITRHDRRESNYLFFGFVPVSHLNTSGVQQGLEVCITSTCYCSITAVLNSYNGAMLTRGATLS